MHWVTGDIWIYYKLGKIIVIPTNPGWKLDGTSVMETGLSKQASDKIKDLPFKYGLDCRNFRPFQYYKDLRLILVPTKILNEKYPYLSWKHGSDKYIITNSLEWLQINVNSFLSDRVYVPLLGTGSGGMQKDLVKNLMDKILISNKFVGVNFL